MHDKAWLKKRKSALHYALANVETALETLRPRIVVGHPDHEETWSGMENNNVEVMLDAARWHLQKALTEGPGQPFNWGEERKAVLRGDS